MTGDLERRSEVGLPEEGREEYLGVRGVEVDEVGLVFTAPIDFAAWEAIGLNLGRVRDWSAWAVGDWLVAGESLFGDDYAQAVEITRRSKVTLLEYQRVARLVLRSRRRPELSFTHHQLIASKSPEEQIDWLDRAVANRWSVEEMRGQLRDDPALSTRRDRSRARVEILELVEDVARALLRASERLGDGYARVPEDVLDRLANALGVKVR